MFRISRRILTVAASTIALATVGLVPSASAAAPIPPQNVITIPASWQVGYVVDAGRCPWLKAYVAALTGQMTKVAAADGHPMAPTDVSGYAVLLAAPMIAAEYGMVGN
jgi:hypothetical protein